MPSTGLTIGKVKAPVSDEILHLFEKVRVSYLSAKEDKKDASITVRVTQKTREKAFADASKRNLSLADWLAQIINAQK